MCTEVAVKHKSSSSSISDVAIPLLQDSRMFHSLCVCVCVCVCVDCLLEISLKDKLGVYQFMLIVIIIYDVFNIKMLLFNFTV